jgi:hypothetical protein
MKLCVVLGIDQYDNTDILGVFDDELLAKTFLEKAKQKFSYDSYAIEEYSLNEELL